MEMEIMINNKTLTEEQRISVIRHAYANSQSVTPRQSVADFIADVKSEAVVAEHGLLDSQRVDLEDESQFLYSDSAEDIDEEDQEIGLSDEMRGIYG
jgi:hypothetical protein